MNSYNRSILVLILLSCFSGITCLARNHGKESQVISRSVTQKHFEEELKKTIDLYKVEISDYNTRAQVGGSWNPHQNNVYNMRTDLDYDLRRLETAYEDLIKVSSDAWPAAKTNASERLHQLEASIVKAHLEKLSPIMP